MLLLLDDEDVVLLAQIAAVVFQREALMSARVTGEALRPTLTATDETLTGARAGDEGLR